MLNKCVSGIDFPARINATRSIFRLYACGSNVVVFCVFFFMLVVIWNVSPCTRPNNNRIRFGFGYLSSVCTLLCGTHTVHSNETKHLAAAEAAAGEPAAATWAHKRFESRVESTHIYLCMTITKITIYEQKM